MTHYRSSAALISESGFDRGVVWPSRLTVPLFITDSTQPTFENALRVLRPGGTLSSLGVYSGKLEIPDDAFGACLADVRIVATLCPGGKERLRRLIDMMRSGRRTSVRCSRIALK